MSGEGEMLVLISRGGIGEVGWDGMGWDVDSVVVIALRGDRVM